MANHQKEPVVIGTTGSQVKLTAEQHEQLAPVQAMIATAFADDEGNANAAINAAIRYLNTSPPDRSLTIERLGEDIADAREEVAQVVAMARATVIVAANDGWSEVALAQNLGVDRMTIRKWLGKRS
jgi:acyl-CoA reductase-like NAD-dependent aldehyde dehydrogenase